MNISDVIMRAAGRATIRFNEEKDADSFYKCFPFLVERFAPSLKFTQAKVTIENNDFNKAFKDIEDILYQNRNINQVSLPEITPLIERNPRTGLASTNKEGEDLLDRQAQRKRDVARISIKLLSKIDKNISNQGEEDKWTDVIDDIAGTTNKYIAVIHADGNDLGKIIRKLKNKKIIKDFSYAVEDATQKAVKEAYEKVILCDYHKQRSLEKKDEAKEKIKIAARPIVIGGDDITMIVRADLAFEFTRIFMEEFEKNTKVNFGNIKDKNKDANLPEKLTSCAGIAFVKKAYPFSRAYELAESLCSYTKGLAKKDNVNYVPSCFSFHKVSASITGDYEDIQKNELTSKDKIKMWYGPYTVGEHTNKLYSFKNLEELVKIFNEIPSTSIRELIDTLYVSFNDAEKDFDRIIQILKGRGKDDIAKKLNENKTLLLNKESSPLLDAHRIKELTKNSVTTDSDAQEEK